MEYMELVKELEQKLVLNQERHDCNADSGEVFFFNFSFLIYDLALL